MVEGARLERVYRETYRGFESHPVCQLEWQLINMTYLDLINSLKNISKENIILRDGYIIPMDNLNISITIQDDCVIHQDTFDRLQQIYSALRKPEEVLYANINIKYANKLIIR